MSISLLRQVLDCASPLALSSLHSRKTGTKILKFTENVRRIPLSPGERAGVRASVISIIFPLFAKNRSAL
jgi:hypothetical protein